ncbi:MAG: bifunctional oligoribonuclease/PAP phosphatase NrnA [Thermodesulfovibrionia bacterium]
MTRIPSKLLNLIRDSRDFLIVTHVNPEGDAIGSSLALAIGLKKMGKDVYLLDKHPVPKTLRFLPYSELFKAQPPNKRPDVLFLIDCNALERTGFNGLMAGRLVIIDHHIIPDRQLQAISYISTSASATGELIYKLLLALKVKIDKDIATNIYTAIMVDTGGFRYSNTTRESLQIAARLVDLGAKPWEIAKEVYENIDYGTMRLFALTLSTLKKRDGIAWLTVTKDMFKKTGTTAEDTENFVDYARRIKGVEVGLLFREDIDGICKVSLRSKGRIDVSRIARGFGGGGHPAAAGCKVKGRLHDVKEMVLKRVRESIRDGIDNKPQ